MKPNRTNPFVRFLVAPVALTTLGLPLAQGANFTWDTVTGDAATITTASGTWDTIATNLTWNNGTTNVVWAAGNVAIFGGTNGTYAITLGGSFSGQGMTFNNSGYTLGATSAQTLTLTNSGSVVTLADNVTATFGNNATVAFNTTSNTGSRVIMGNSSVLNVSSGATFAKNSTAQGGFVFRPSATNSSSIINVDGTVSWTNSGGQGGISLSEGVAGTVTMNVNSGGVLSSAANGAQNNKGAIIVGDAGAATLNVASGATVTISNTAATSFLNIGASNAAESVGTLNFNGGTITAPQVRKTGGAATGIFNFNGGTLKANVANTVYMTGLTRANVRNGGALIDTNGVDITVGQPLLHSNIGGDAATDGGLTKSGAGILTLSGASTYTGNTTLSGGSLVLADNAALKFVVTNAASNKIQGTGAVTLDGDFVIDITGVTSPNPSGYTLVSGVTPTYGFTFSVVGWTEVIPGEWRGSGWKFTTADGKLVSLDSDTDGIEDAWEMQIVNASPSDGITNVSQVLPGADFDGDQVTNLMEYTYGTSPINPNEWPDTDGDGLNDGWEDATFGDHDGIIEPSDLTTATAADTDGDGLIDFWEDQYYGNNDGIIDPSDLTVQNDKNADPDGDHNTNAQESVANTNPKDNTSWPDADIDGLNDGWELFAFGTLTRATAFDIDGDFLADTYEDAYFGDNSGTIEPSDLTAQNAGGDPDGDGAFNFQESLSFTDPENATEFPDLDGDGLGDGHFLRLADGNSATTTSFIDGTNWDNEAAPVAGQKYVVAVNGLRTRATTGDFTFAGDRLALASGGALVWKNNGSVTISNLVLCGGLVNQAVEPNNTTVNLNGAISVTGFGSTLSGNNGPLVVNSTISGAGQLNITGSRTVTLTAANPFVGDLVVAGNLVVGNGTTGSLSFKPVSGGTANKISGSGTLSFNGPMNIDTSTAGTSVGESWSLVDAGTLTETYGANFTIPGFTAGAGTAGNRIWTKTGSPVWYQFSESTGLFIVMSPDTDFDGMADSFEQLIINANPGDAITTLADVNPLDDFDGDHTSNLMEFVHHTSPTDPNSWPDTDFDGINDGYEDFAFGDHDGLIEPTDLTTATAFDTDGDGWDDQGFEDVNFGDNDGVVEPSDLLQAPFTDFDGDGASNRQELVVDFTDAKSNASFTDVDSDGIADGARLTAGDANGGTTSFNGNVGHWSDGFGPLAGMNYYVAADSLRTPDNTPADTVLTFPGNRLVIAPGGKINFKSTSTHTISVNQLVLDGAILNQAGGGNVITLASNGVTIRSASTYTGSNGPMTISAPISGSGALTSSGGTLSFAGTNTWTGNLTANGPFALAATGTMKFVPTTNGTTNSISGTGNVTLNGTFQIDLGGTTPTIGHSWPLVANTGTKTYGATFSVAGFTSNGAAAGVRRWSSGNYQFDEATGTLSVAQPGFAGWIGGFGLAAGDQGPNADPDHDGISNLIEYAVDGLNPAAGNGSVGSLSGLTVTFAKRALAVSNGDVSYAIEQSTDLGGADVWGAVTPTVNSPSIISYTFPGSTAKDFIRLQVTQP